MVSIRPAQGAALQLQHLENQAQPMKEREKQLVPASA